MSTGPIADYVVYELRRFSLHFQSTAMHAANHEGPNRFSTDNHQVTLSQISRNYDTYRRQLHIYTLSSSANRTISQHRRNRHQEEQDSDSNLSRLILDFMSTARGRAEEPVDRVSQYFLKSCSAVFCRNLRDSRLPVYL
jgi:hypothetical protein